MQTKIPIHSSLTFDKVADAAKRCMFGLENTGFCIRCGLEHDGLEPDARRRPCEACGSNSVYGAEELVIMLGL